MILPTSKNSLLALKGLLGSRARRFAVKSNRYKVWRGPADTTIAGLGCQMGADVPYLCSPLALGQLWLKGALNNFLQTSGDGVAQESAEHGDVCRYMHGLRVDLHLDPESDPLQPDLAAVSGPLHLPDQCAEPTLDLVDS